MRLKRLVLQGYKTFYNKTEFVFDSGITAVVGPNGSGKSNVADAIRWVLGEQSYSELRGKKTIDMIWAGSQSRPRAGMASAVLTLDNDNGWLPIDYAEVEIGRRAYRSGENEYTINGNRVRLRDVRDLLATSGLAERTYTMVGQGLIDRALSIRADERRALFEEAAGISHYKARRAETLRRLEETQHNIERVNDLLSELRPRLRNLERQASRARNYEQIQRDLRHLLRDWYGYQWESVRLALRGVRIAAAEYEAAWKTSRRQLLALQEQLDEQRRRLNQARAQHNAKQEQRDALREQLEQLRRDVAILGERQKLVQRQLAEIEPELPDLAMQRDQAQRELDVASTDLQAAQQALEAERSVLMRFEATFQSQQAVIATRQKALRDLENREQERRRQRSQAEGQLSQLRERLREQTDALPADTERQQTAERIAALDAQLGALQSERDALAKRRRDLRQRQQQLDAERKQRERAEADLNREINRQQQELARLEARAELLNQMRREATALAGADLIEQRLADLIAIPADLRVALEAALSTRLNTLIVANDAALTQLLAANPERALLAVARSAIHQQPEPAAPDHGGVIGWATALTESRDSRLTSLLLHAILVVEDNATALTLARSLPHGTLVVARSGLVVHAGGIVEQRPIDARTSVLAQEEAWRAADAAVSAARSALGERDAERLALQKQAAAQQTTTDALSDEERKLQREEQTVNNKRLQLQSERDRAQQHVSYLERQQAAFAQEQQRITGRIAELEANAEGWSVELVKLESSVGEARTELAALPVSEVGQQREQQQQKIATARTILEGRRAVVDSRRATLGQIENRLQRQRQRHESLLAQQAEIDLAGSEQRLAVLQGRASALDGEIAPLRQSYEALQAALSDRESDLIVLQKEAHEIETLYTESRLARNQQENRLENLRERIHADLGIVELSHDEDETVQTPLPISEVVEKLPRIDTLPDGIEESIAKRRAQLQRIGPVNPEAVEEFDTTQERVEFLSQQIEDLIHTEAQLRKVIGELDTLTSHEFARTVEQVNTIFADTFTRLFGGGSAELILTEPDNLTVSGVDILARLPRRREQGLGLLSGGERSLTATALIFALLKVSPPPFCVLDEVDAALDEANITRFRDLLRELSRNTQFIVITHNRGTVQAANTLYGISMGTDSVSQVISIKPDDYVSSDAHE